MIGLVLVSHSKTLASGIRELILEIAGPDFPVAIASGTGKDHNEPGTDAVYIAEILRPFVEGDGAVVLMDLGSAVLSAEMAIELLEPDVPGCREKVRLSAAPLVEGAIAAAVEAQASGSFNSVCREAQRALAPKQAQLHDGNAGVPPASVVNPLGLRSVSTPESEIPTLPATTREIVLTIENEHGLHARPAAALVRALSSFSSLVEISNLSRRMTGPGQDAVTARSLTSLILLQVRQGDRVRVRASGADAEAALAEVARLAVARFGENGLIGSRSSLNRAAEIPTVRESEPPREVASGSRVIQGTPASDGVAIGRLLLMDSCRPEASATGEEHPRDRAAEFSRLIEAMRKAEQRLRQRGARAGDEQTEIERILEAQVSVLSDPAVLERAKTLVERRGSSAAGGWQEITNDLAASYQALDDAYLRERAADIRDIGRLVLQELAGALPAGSIRPDPPAILFVRELLPSEAAACDPDGVLGVIASEGSAVTHSAIMLRSAGIPVVAGISMSRLTQSAGEFIGLDGSTGEVWIEPSDAIRAKLADRRREWQAQRYTAEVLANEPCVTLDGQRIEVVANVASVAEARLAARNGAEGIGVLRTELLFLARSEAPPEVEQEQALRALLAPIPPDHPVVVRALDAGADKPLPFLPQPDEQNPYLGVRGIRLLLQHEDFFLAHLRAILVAGAGRNLWVMFPMVTETQEIERARRLLDRAHLRLEESRKQHAWPVKVGAMIEVPSAALLADQLAGAVDFLSIGTNDLTQYTLGAERGNVALSAFQDALHPAVLRLIVPVVEAAAKPRCHVAVCGDAASDPVAAVVFFGLGIRSLSVRPNQVQAIKKCFRGLRGSDLLELGRKALDGRNAAQVRALAAEYLKSRQ